MSLIPRSRLTSDSTRSPSVAVATSSAPATMTLPVKAGQRVSVRIPATTASGSCGDISTRNPDGSLLAVGCLAPGGFVDAAAVNAAGGLPLLVAAAGQQPSSVAVGLLGWPDWVLMAAAVAVLVLTRRLRPGARQEG